MKKMWPKVWAGGQWVLLGVAMWLATVPAWLVMRDRWGRNAVSNDQIFAIWERVKFRLIEPLPDYFWMIFACVGVLLGISWGLRVPRSELWEEETEKKQESWNDLSPRQKKVAKYLGRVSLLAFLLLGLPMVGNGPSGASYAVFCALYLMAWGVGTISWRALWAWLQANGEFWLSVILAHGALVGVGVSLYTQDLPLWLTGATLMLALANLFRFRKRLNPVFWVVSLTLILGALYINAWWFSVIGDEFAFYDNAIWIAKTWREIPLYLFRGTFVYGQHPFFSTLMQAGFINVLGASNFSWRVSGLYLTALALVLYYDFWRRFLSRKIALWSVFILGMSHYIFTFGKVGYNNLQGLLAVGLVLWATGWAVQSKRRLAFVAVGLAQAFCFYSFTGALIAVPLPYLFFLFYDWPQKPYGQTLKRWGVSLLTLGLFIFPLLWQQPYWQSFTILSAYTQETNRFAPFASASLYYQNAILQHLISPLYLVEQTHFVVSSLLDPLSGSLFLLGFFALVWGLRGKSFLRPFALSFAYIFGVLVLTSSHPAPALTRVFFILPWLAVVSALGIVWLVAWLKRVGLSEKVRNGFVALLFVAITGLNLWQAYPISYQNSGQYQTIQVYYLKAAQYLFDSKRDTDPRTSIVLVSQINIFINSIKDLLDIYRIPYPDAQLTQAYKADEIPPEALTSPWTLIMVSRMDEKTTAEVVALLETTDKTPCSVSSITGYWLFDLWVSPGMEDVCGYLQIEPFEGWLH